MVISPVRAQDPLTRPVKLGVDALGIRYGDHLALQDVTLDVQRSPNMLERLNILRIVPYKP